MGMAVTEIMTCFLCPIPLILQIYMEPPSECLFHVQLIVHHLTLIAGYDIIHTKNKRTIYHPWRKQSIHTMWFTLEIIGNEVFNIQTKITLLYIQWRDDNSDISLFFLSFRTHWFIQSSIIVVVRIVR